MLGADRVLNFATWMVFRRLPLWKYILLYSTLSLSSLLSFSVPHSRRPTKLRWSRYLLKPHTSIRMIENHQLLYDVAGSYHDKDSTLRERGGGVGGGDNFVKSLKTRHPRKIYLARSDFAISLNLRYLLLLREKCRVPRNRDRAANGTVRFKFFSSFFLPSPFRYLQYIDISCMSRTRRRKLVSLRFLPVRSSFTR